MENINIVGSISNAEKWLVHYQTLLLNYAVNVVIAIIISVTGVFIARIIANSFDHLLQTRHIDSTIANFLSTLARHGITTFSLITALSYVGVQTASIVTVLGAASLAAGLALRESLSNLAAGVLLVLFRPFRVGEFIDLGNVKGTVLHIQIFCTTLCSNDGKIVVVQNSKVTSSNIINYSRALVRRNEFIISVAYNADVDHVISLLREVVKSDPRVLQDRGVQIGLNELASSSLNFVVRCWSNSSDLQNVYWDLMKNFKLKLDAHGIGIPYPQMDVHLHQIKSINTVHQMKSANIKKDKADYPKI